MEDAVRWNIKVSREIDLTLRTYLGAQGMKKGDLSKFIEDAVRWRIFNRTVQEIKSRNADADPDQTFREQHAVGVAACTDGRHVGIRRIRAVVGAKDRIGASGEEKARLHAARRDGPTFALHVA